VAGITGRFWNKRRERPCKFRDAAAVEELRALVERQLASALSETPASG